MKHFYKLFFIRGEGLIPRPFRARMLIIFLFLPLFIYPDENIKIFLNINWQTSPEYVISILGLPDNISYDYGDNGKLLNNENGVEYRIAVETVWINDLIDDTGSNEINISEIINGHDNIWLRYNNVSCFNFSSTIFLIFEDGKYNSISIIIDTENLTINEKNNISAIFSNYYFELYGTPNKILQNNNNVFAIWYLNNSMIMLEAFLPENDLLYAQYRYVDTISVFHSYRKN